MSINTKDTKKPRRGKGKGDKNMELETISAQIRQQPHAARHSNSKKNHVSINHLLSFSSYRDSPEYQQRHSGQKPKPRRLSGNDRYRQKLYLHGMRFINVNYKFVVDYRKPYTPQQLDPNVPVDTDDIIRIIVPKGNACPICLSEELIAPRMITSCGHILCLTCLLSLLESEVPTKMKKESSAIVEKYNDCPLCGSIIRKKDVKPVQIENVDERFEIPKIGDDVILSLMTRKPASLVPVPSTLQQNGYVELDLFPWAGESDSYLRDYSRFFKADYSYLVKMYEEEKRLIKEAQARDKELYDDDGKFAKLAVSAIDKDMEAWLLKFEGETANNGQRRKEPNHTPPFYYYQTGFKSPTTYVLSSLDMKVLRSSYGGEYANLPHTIIAKVDNIRYEELDSETAHTKYKYLSHLPSGTSLGFLECDWRNNEYLSGEVWEANKDALIKRSKTSAKKRDKEEQDRRRAMLDEEQRARDFINRENQAVYGSHENDSYLSPSSFQSLSISDYMDLPTLATETVSGSNSGNETEESTTNTSTKKSVWGTQVPRAELEDVNGDDFDNDWDAEEMIRRAREEIERQAAAGGKSKKKKKKLVLLSS